MLACCAGTASAAQQQAMTRAQQPAPDRAAAEVLDPAAGVSEADAARAAAEGARLMRKAETVIGAEKKHALLNRAEDSYTRAVATDPEQGTALNNLAVIAVQKGDTANARDYFERAIATNDGHEGFYALNYSKYLEASDLPAAIDAARTAVTAAPESALANQQLGSLLWRTKSSDLLPFANSLVERGDTALATRFALQCLQSGDRPPEERRAWLILLASRLANEYSISDEVRSSISNDLATLQSDPEVGAGSSQLRAVISEPPAGIADVEWWSRQTSSAPPQTASGRDAMRDVLLSAGAFAATQGSPSAEGYFKTAIDLGNRGPDPAAFVKLVELYANLRGDESASQEGLAQLAALMEEYQYSLFTEKGDAYARGDWPLIYRMHTALGMTYAYLGVWQSEVPYQNGIFQLSNAMNAAARSNAGSAEGASKLALPRVGIEQLVRGYQAIGRTDLATKARVDGAAALQDAGYSDDGRMLFGAVTADDVRELDATTQSKYEALLRTL